MVEIGSASVDHAGVDGTARGPVEFELRHGRGRLAGWPAGLELEIFRFPMFIPWDSIQSVRLEPRFEGEYTVEVLAIRVTGPGFDWPWADWLNYTRPGCMAIPVETFESKRAAATAAAELDYLRLTASTTSGPLDRPAGLADAIPITPRPPARGWRSRFFGVMFFTVALAGVLVLAESVTLGDLGRSVLGALTTLVCLGLGRLFWSKTDTDLTEP